IPVNFWFCTPVLALRLPEGFPSLLIVISRVLQGSCLCSVLFAHDISPHFNNYSCHRYRSLSEKPLRECCNEANFNKQAEDGFDGSKHHQWIMQRSFIAKTWKEPSPVKRS